MANVGLGRNLEYHLDDVTGSIVSLNKIIDRAEQTGEDSTARGYVCYKFYVLRDHIIATIARQQLGE